MDVHGLLMEWNDTNVWYNVSASDNATTLPKTANTSPGNVTYIYSGKLLDYANQQQFNILVPSFVYTLILMLVGLPGNVIVIIIYLLKMGRTTSRNFIISLAVCDFINCAFGMPVELSLLANYYRFDFPILCKVSRFSTFFMNNTSSAVLLGIAVDRFRRVCVPLRRNMTVNHSKIICIAACAFSLVSAVPALFIYGTRTIILPAGNSTMLVLKTCYINDHIGTKYPMVFNLYLFILVLVIFFALTIMYALVGRVVCLGKRIARESLRSGSMYSFSTVKSESGFTPASNRNELHKNSFSLRIWRSISESSPRRLRNKSKPNGMTDVAELHAVRDSNVTGMSVRRHGGKAIRAGRTTLILFIVTLLFILSFVPYLAIVTLRYINPHMLSDMTPLEWSVYNFTLRSYLLNSAINPLIYCFLNRQFRMKVKLCFLSFFRCK